MALDPYVGPAAIRDRPRAEPGHYVHSAAGLAEFIHKNPSTGYCPDPDCWPAVRDALALAGSPGPPGFTSAFVFRRCPRCGQTNLVKEDEFVCAVRDAELPRAWNF